MCRIGLQAAVIVALGVALPARADQTWPQFRGPGGQGHAPGVHLPLSWSETENVRWKTALPGEGWSSPVVAGREVWMTTAMDGGKSLRALCVDCRTGKLVHDVEVFRVDEPENINPKNSYASPTPAIDERHVYVHYGTYGTACLARSTGSIVWRNAELKLDHKEGPGSSPILYHGLLIVHCDGMDVQYIVALDAQTGRVVWKTPRTGKIHDNPDFRKAYSTPLVVNVDGRDLLVSTAAQQAMAYDPLTGAEIWKVRYQGFSNVARPIAGSGLVYLVSDFGRPKLLAVDPRGQGDITDTNIVWTAPKQVASASSPLLVEGGIYMVTNRGVASCLDAKTGESRWTERLGGNFSASPLAADGRIYLFSEEGKTHAIEPGPAFKLLATSTLDGHIMASPAVADGALLLRTDTHLYRIESGRPHSTTEANRRHRQY